MYALRAVGIGAALGRWERGELPGSLRPCFALVEPWLQAGKYVGTVLSGLPKHNGWTPAEQAGDATPDRMQRLFNRAVWFSYSTSMSTLGIPVVPGPASKMLTQRRPTSATLGGWIRHRLMLLVRSTRSWYC